MKLTDLFSIFVLNARIIGYKPLSYSSFLLGSFLDLMFIGFRKFGVKIRPFLNEILQFVVVPRVYITNIFYGIKQKPAFTAQIYRRINSPLWLWYIERHELLYVTRSLINKIFFCI